MSTVERQMLARVLHDLTWNGTDVEAARWFADGVQGWLSGEHRSLDIALQLRGAGKALPATENRLQARNAALQRAFDLVETGENVSTDDRVRALVASIEKLDRCRNPNPMQAELIAAREYGELPVSTRHIRRILLGRGGD